MSETGWMQATTPLADADILHTWQAAPRTLAELTRQRVHLGTTLSAAGDPDVDEADLERLLLAFEELVSNGLRHGGGDIRVTLTTTPDAWVLDVRDPSPGQPPAEAIGRDPALGGLGLTLVARLAADQGWYPHGDHKHVWARLEYTSNRSARPAAKECTVQSGAPTSGVA